MIEMSAKFQVWSQFLNNEKNGVLYGMFNFKLTNILDEADTLEIDKGYFEITLDESDRVW